MASTSSGSKPDEEKHDVEENLFERIDKYVDEMAGGAVAVGVDRHRDASRHAPGSCLHGYLRLAARCRRLVDTRGDEGDLEPYFGTAILLCIVLAGLLVGLATYKSLSPDEESGRCEQDEPAACEVIVFLDNAILLIFGVECVIKFIGEGTAPWRYFCGPDRAWNNFDFVVVVACIPGVAPMDVAILRLFRLARLIKILNKVPQLKMIVMGIIGGLKSIAYIVLLLFLIFYLFAIAGEFFCGRGRRGARGGECRLLSSARARQAAHLLLRSSPAHRERACLTHTLSPRARPNRHGLLRPERPVALR